MQSLVIDNIDDRVVRDIASLAQENHLGLEAQAKRLLEQAVASIAGQPDRRQRAFDEAGRIAAMTPKGVVQTDSTALVREDRDR